MTKQKAALVLSGGGSLGIAHIGVLDNIEDQYDFDFIAGVSAGAIIGAAIALGKNAEAVWHIFNDTNLFDMALDFSPKNAGLIKGRKIHQLLTEVYEDKSFEDLAVPLYIGATDFENGERVVISTGKIADAVRASLGIPMVFEPYEHPSLKRKLVDGYLSQNFPLDLAIDNYAGDSIIGVNVAAVPPMPKKLGPFQILQRQLRIMYKNQHTHLLKNQRLQVYEPDLSTFSSMSLGHKNFKAIRNAGRLSVKKC